MNEFFAMGGYAAYVWSAFGLTLLMLVANIVAARRQFRLTKLRLAQRLSGQPEAVQ